MLCVTKGKGEKDSTELGFFCRTALEVLSGYRPSIRVVLTDRATIPIPLEAR